MSKKLGLFFVIPLMLVLCLASFSFGEKETAYADFDEYAQAYKSMIGDSDFLDNYKERSIAYDEVIEVDGKKMIEKEAFCEAVGEDFELTKNQVVNASSLSIGEQKTTYVLKNSNGDAYAVEGVSVVDGESYLPLDGVAKSLSYELKYGEDKIDVVKTFETKRLIVTRSGKVNNCGAIRGAENSEFSIFEYETEQKTLDAYNNLLKQKNVITVESDSVIKAESEDVSTKGLMDSFSYTSWGARAMNVEDYSSYLLNKGEQNLPTVYVAVLDTGIDTDHPWFTNRIASNFGENFIDNSNSFEDGAGHGTHVSGIIVDLTFSNVKIIPVKILDDNGYGYRSGIISGVSYIRNLKSSSTYSDLNIVAMNMSLGMETYVGGTEHTQVRNQIVAALNDYNILSIVASGNEAMNAMYSCPANVLEAITVGAVAQSGFTYSHPSWSNYGGFVDVSAPGSEILSAKVGGGVVYESGTSMAAPHISGCVALLYSDPNKNYSASDVENILKTNVIDLGDEGKDDYFGYGMVDMQYAYRQTVDVVSFSKENGACYEPFMLTLSHTDPSASIYYTIDGTDPTKDSGIKYTSPIEISVSTTVKAIAYLNIGTEHEIFSKVSQKSYYFSNTDIDNNYIVHGEILIGYKGNLKQLIVPTSINGTTITKVGENAFAGTDIEAVTFSNEVTSIGEEAFANCTKLESVYAPKVENIEYRTFYNCRKLSVLDDGYFGELKKIGTQSFYNCESLKTITLSKLETIDYQAFHMQDGLSPKLMSVNFPSVKTISEEAFVYCTSLQEVIMPNVETICSDAFYCCSIRELSLPEVKNLGNYAFYNNLSLKTVSIPKAQIISSYCFHETSLTDIYANEATFVGKYAFYNVKNLQNVQMSSLKEIGEYAFYGCTNLNSLLFENVQIVHNHAFSGCYLLNTISLPRVISIQNNAFENCGLSEFSASESLSEIGKDILSGVKKSCRLKIYSHTPIYKYAQNNKFTIIKQDSSSPLLFEQKGTEITILGYSSSSNTVVVPSYIDDCPVTKIADNAFSGCDKIKMVNSSFITEVGKNAFKGCKNLSYVSLGSAKTIGDGAFSGCEKLQSLNIENATEIGTEAFYNCPKLLSATVNKEVTQIGDRAFAYLNKVNGIYQMVSTFVLYGYNTVAQNYVAKVNSQKTDEDIIGSSETDKVNSSISYKENYYVLTTSDFSYVCYNGTARITLAKNYLSGNIIIPEKIIVNGDEYTIVGLGDMAFDDCSFIENVVLPSGITNISEGSFKNCSRLKSINLSNIVSIQKSAFEGCDSLKVANMPKVTSIGIKAFKDCLSLEKVVAPRLSSVYDNSFTNCLNLKSAEVPDGIYIPTVNNSDESSQSAEKPAATGALSLPTIVLLFIILASVVILSVCFVFVFKVFNRQA